MQSIQNINIKGKRVFLRADLNIPMKNNEILQDFKLKKIIPTINYIQKHGGKVILATHIGRPDPSEIKNFFDEKLSTKILIPWFQENNFKIKYETDLKKAATLSHENFSEILLLENMRFFNGERGNNKERKAFANYLSNLSDTYINDAFALYHRDDCSVKQLPEMFKEENKAYGLLFENEIHNLNQIKHNPAQPFVFILGGNKLETKIILLQELLKKERQELPQTIIIGGSIAQAFLSAKDSKFRVSTVTKEEIELATTILNTAKNKNIQIILPIDYITNNGIFETNSFPLNESSIDIGPETVKLFMNEIKTAQSIFINGVMGIYENIESQNGTKQFLSAVANSSAYKVAGGGDCVAAIYMFKLEDKFNFLSTGGGATLKFIA